MSIEAMRHVWHNSKSKGSARLTLLAIADIANDSGDAYPGVDTITEKCNASDRTTQNMIHELERLGELQVFENVGAKTKSGWTNLYRVVMPGIRQVEIRTPAGLVAHPRPVATKPLRENFKGVQPFSPLQPTKGVQPFSPHGVQPFSPESSEELNTNTKKKINKRKLDFQDAPIGTPGNGASAPVASPSKKKPTAKKPAAPSETKTPPPAPPAKKARPPRKTDLQKWLERAAAQEAMVVALLVQFDKGFDPAFQKVREYATLKTLEKYVPAAEDLARVGCKPEDVKEIYTWLKPLYNKNKWTIGLDTISLKYGEWRAWKAQQNRPAAPAVRPPQKSVPVVHNSAEQRQLAQESLAVLREARAKQPL